MITYATNHNTAEVVRQLAASATAIAPDAPLRILLETDAPFMAPSNLYASLPAVKGRLPLSHSAMIPWTAQFTADVANERVPEGSTPWDALRVLRESAANARAMYGV